MPKFRFHVTIPEEETEEALLAEMTGVEEADSADTLRQKLERKGFHVLHILLNL